MNAGFENDYYGIELECDTVNNPEDTFDECFLNNDLKMYLTEISRIPQLSTEEEYSLLERKNSEDTSARERLIEGNLKLVVYFAKRYAGDYIDMMDLIQEGTLGLIEAVERFDITKGVKLSTYAAHWINKYLLAYFKKEINPVHIPENVIAQIKMVKDFERDYQSKYGFIPNVLTISQSLGLDEKEIAELRALSYGSCSLDKPLKNEETLVLGDTIESSDYSPEDNVVASVYYLQMKEALERLVEQLNTRQAKVIKLRFGLEDGIKWTVDDISRKYNISKSRVKQIELDALKELRCHFDKNNIQYEAA